MEGSEAGDPEGSVLRVGENICITGSFYRLLARQAAGGVKGIFIGPDVLVPGKSITEFP